MNIVLTSQTVVGENDAAANRPSTGKPVEFYLACVQHGPKYFVLGKYVSPEGKLRTTSKDGPFETEGAATERCRTLAKTKIRKKGFAEIPINDVPEKVAPFLEMPPDIKVSPMEMIRLVKEARRERYVVFKDVVGIDEYFDVGVEYVALTTGEKGVLLVYDRFGDPRECFVERMSSISPTEDAKRAEGLKKL